MSFAARIPNIKVTEEPDWQPYCLVCSTMNRMRKMPYGFICDPAEVEPDRHLGLGMILKGRRGCGNKIGVDLRHMDDDEAQALTEGAAS